MSYGKLRQKISQINITYFGFHHVLGSDYPFYDCPFNNYFLKKTSINKTDNLLFLTKL